MPGCKLDYATFVSIANYGLESTHIDYILWSVFIIFLTVSYFLAVAQARKISLEIGEKIDTPSDFTVLIGNIPLEEKDSNVAEYIGSTEKKEGEATVSVVRNLTNMLSRVSKIDLKQKTQDAKDNSSKVCYSVEKVSKVFNITEFTEIIESILKLRKKRARFRVMVDQSMGLPDVTSAHKYMRKVLAVKREIKELKLRLEEMKS